MHMPHLRIGRKLVLTAALLPLSVAGCGVSADDTLTREAVSGSVTLDGQPLLKGTVQFMPTGANQATTGSAPIKSGAYTIPTAQGLVAGDYSVRIYSAVDAAASVADLPGEPAPPPRESIPAKYNTRTTLSAKVAHGQANTFTFDLKGR